MCRDCFRYLTINDFLQTFFIIIVHFRYVISPFGRSLGIKSTRTKRAAPNPILEAAYTECSRLRHKTVSKLF